MAQNKSYTNENIAEVLREIANALEEQDDNPYRMRAYRRAASSILRYPKNIHALWKEQADLTAIPYVGTRIAKVVEKIIVGDRDIFPQHIPAKPYPEKLKNKKKKLVSYKIYNVMAVIEKLLARLNSISQIKKLACTGDYRRKKEVVTDFDIIMVTKDPRIVFEIFHTFPALQYIMATEANYTKVQLKIGLQITLRAVSESNWGTELLYLTGSKDHYEKLIEIAQQQNLCSLETNHAKPLNIIASSEEKIYQSFNLQYIEPELRENRGEIAAAAKNALPKLVTLADIKGDLHCHTNETDGLFSLEEMVLAAKAQGYQYVAITDHSKSLKITNGMDETRLLRQMEIIDRLNSIIDGITILKSMEIDILEDGSLDLHEDVLRRLDITVCSIHSKFKLSSQKQTERIIRAMDNPYFNILGHATGRLIKHRPPYEVDIEKVFQAAKERNCFIEVNSQPARLDINDLYCRRAKEIGVKVAISSDAHTTNGFNFMVLGVNQARRGWLEAKDVINTYTLQDLRKIIKKK